MASNTHDKIQRFLLLALILLTIAIILQEWRPYRSTEPHAQLSEVWGEDIALLKKRGRLPEAFNHLRNIEVRAGDLGAQALLKEVQVPLEHSKEGTHDLEILVTTWRTKKDWGTIVQYDLVDPTGNTIWEVGRTFHMKNPAPKEAAFLLED